MNKKHIIVLGAGPAGISAALYARRGGAEVTVISRGMDSSALAKAEKIENYYGFPEPISSKELLQRGIDGAKRLGVNFIEEELLALGYDESFTGFCAETKNQKLKADSVIIATGASRSSLSIEGVKAFEGKGISYCAICDAFFYRAKTVAVIGAGPYALHEAKILLPHAEKVFLLTNGEVPSVKIPEEIMVHTERLEKIIGEERVKSIVFDNGSTRDVDGVFLAIGTAGSTALARKMGILLDGNRIKTNESQATNVPGLFAAGDCTGGLLQISKAVYEGSVAGLSAVKYLQEKERK